MAEGVFGLSAQAPGARLPTRIALACAHRVRACSLSDRTLGRFRIAYAGTVRTVNEMALSYYAPGVGAFSELRERRGLDYVIVERVPDTKHKPSVVQD